MHVRTLAAAGLMCTALACRPAAHTSAHRAALDTTTAVPTVAQVDTSCVTDCPPPNETVAATYVLVEVDGRPLPHTRYFFDPQDAGRRCTVIDEGAVLTLAMDGSYRKQSTGKLWCDDMQRPDTSRMDEAQGRYEIHGDSVRMDAVPPAPDPPVEYEGRRAGDELRLVNVSAPPEWRRRHRYVLRRD